MKINIIEEVNNWSQNVCRFSVGCRRNCKHSPNKKRDGAKILKPP